MAYKVEKRPDPKTAADRTAEVESIDAVLSLLNCYEFLALGIRRRDLDGAMLRGSVRGIMCNLVADMRVIVEYEQGAEPESL